MGRGWSCLFACLFVVIVMLAGLPVLEKQTLLFNLWQRFLFKKQLHCKSTHAVWNIFPKIFAFIWAPFDHDILNMYGVSLPIGSHRGLSLYFNFSWFYGRLSLLEVPLSTLPSSSPKWFCVCHLAHMENEISGPWKFGNNSSTCFHVLWGKRTEA